jgi:hypothetical protein
MHIVRFANGQGIEHWAVRDDASLMRQLTTANNTESAPSEINHPAPT